ncbi:NusG domain II-containing protein [Desulfosporosinus fructosivorans]
MLDTGWIETAYQSIVCLPNQITVRIEGEKGDEIFIVLQKRSCLS